MSSLISPETTERITVDLPAQDYARLKLIAAAGGRGFTMTSIVRNLVHDFLETDEDAADLALIAQRKKNQTPLLSQAEVNQALADHR